MATWARLMANGAEPQLRWLYAIPNAGAGAQRGQAGKMKAEGVQPGVPDLALDVPIGSYHGARIEMKRRGAKPTAAQVEWADHLQSVGYAYCLAYTFEEARDFLISYLNGAL